MLIRVEVRGGHEANGCVIAFESHLDPLKGLFMWFARPPNAQGWVILSLEYCLLSYSRLVWKILYIVISTERSTRPVMLRIFCLFKLTPNSNNDRLCYNFGHLEPRVESGEISKIRSQRLYS